MKKIKKSTKFKKDFKKYKNDPIKVDKILDFIEILIEEKEIPAHYKTHYLKGDYKGCLECHLEGDLLIIWIDPNDDTIYLERVGSHAELFRKF